MESIETPVLRKHHDLVIQRPRTIMSRCTQAYNVDLHDLYSVVFRLLFTGLQTSDSWSDGVRIWLRASSYIGLHGIFNSVNRKHGLANI